MTTKTNTAGAAITRREALQLTLAAGISATAITFAVTDPATAAAEGVFLHGVASGDPLRDRVVIWTRVTMRQAQDKIPVAWTVAADRQMHRIVRQGRTTARAERDHTVKIDVDGLKPGETYYYRFEVDGERSPVGRTRTLPVGDVSKLKLAVFSCSNYELGYFNAYGEAAKLDDLDAVLHLGDYIYEYGPGIHGYTTPAAAAGLVDKPRDAKLQPREEIVLLDQYRARHALYRTDANLKRLHRDNPFINIWDDHEVANDAWTGGAGNHQPDEGGWLARKHAGIRAFYEWLPIREPSDGDRIDPATGTPDDLYRAFDFGNLARLVMLDTRQAGRDEQLGAEALVVAYTGAPPQGPFPRDVRADGKARTLLGRRQQTWAAEQIAGSKQTWQLIGNQVLMFYQGSPDFLGTALFDDTQKAQFQALLDQLLGEGSGEFLGRLGLAGLPFPLAADAWTGYPTARVEMLKLLARAKNPVVFTGDSHNAWTANLALPAGDGTKKPVAPEFGGTSVSSPGYEQEIVGVDPAVVSALLVDTSSRKSPADALVFMDASRRGFMLVEVTETAVTVDHVFVSTALEHAYTTEARRFRVDAGSRMATPVAAG
jgi:alkaline phosphatase D